MTLLACEDVARDLRIFGGCAALEVVLGAAGKAEVLGFDGVGLEPAILDLADLGRCASPAHSPALVHRQNPQRQPRHPAGSCPDKNWPEALFYLRHCIFSKEI